MKANEYVKKYHIDTKKAFNYRLFCRDMGKDFGELLHSYGKEDFTEDKFEVIIKELKQKFDSINNKALYGVPIKIWNYFYATTISNKRRKMFPNSLKNKEKVKKYRKDYFRR